MLIFILNNSIVDIIKQKRFIQSNINYEKDQEKIQENCKIMER